MCRTQWKGMEGGIRGVEGKEAQQGEHEQELSRSERGSAHQLWKELRVLLGQSRAPHPFPLPLPPHRPQMPLLPAGPSKGQLSLCKQSRLSHRPAGTAGKLDFLFVFLPSLNVLP